MSDYRFDLFLSYSRAPASRRWVATCFLPLLEEWLHEELGRPPTVFLDQRDIPTGSPWPQELEEALRDARLLLAVLSQPYFNSSWCTTEWSTMVARERKETLIYPVRFSDGESFPEPVMKRQTRDLRRYALNSPSFPLSPLHLEFEQKMREIAGELAGLIRNAPPWSPQGPPTSGQCLEPAFPRPKL